LIELSVVVPTVNRAESLRSCLTAAGAATSRVCEIIVVDGASSDHTSAVLEEARSKLGDRLRIISEDRREGFVRAANKGFRAARGQYLTWLNDDARPLPGSFDVAIQHLESDPKAAGECGRSSWHGRPARGPADFYSDLAQESPAPRAGLAALFHSTQVMRNVAIATRHLGRSFNLLHVRGTLYANFGVGRRELFERLGYFDERYFLNAADPDLSLKVWDAGFAVIPAHGAFIDHDELADERRQTDLDSGAVDNAKLFEKWDLPDRYPNVVYDAARPCTSRGLRPPLRQAV
jgi:GT2 family glycosyltransferase